MASPHPFHLPSKKRLPVCCFCLFLFFAFLTGCQQFTKQSEFMNLIRQNKKNDFKLTPSELRASLNDSSDEFEGMIEDGADDIISKSNDAAIKKNALLWKANAIPIIHETLYHPDPLVAIIDTKAFILQMIQFFENGPGKTAFGPWHENALEVCRKMNKITLDIGVLLTGKENDQDFIEELTAWVKANPIVSLNFYRASLSTEIASIIGEKKVDTFRAMGNLALGMNDIAARMNVYSRHLPKQARWQAEILMSDTLPPDSGKVMLEQLMVLSDSISRISSLAEMSPAIIEKERKILLNTVQKERVHILKTFQAEHELARKWLTGERKIILDAVDTQRGEIEKGVQKILSGERKAVTATLLKERKAVLSEVEAMRERLIREAAEHAEQTATRLMIKFGVFLAVFLLCIGAVIMLLIKRRQNDEPVG